MTAIRVFKFGGASVKDADAVRNVAAILSRYAGEKIVVVVSAMGKTTNALEHVHRARFTGEPVDQTLRDIVSYHRQIIFELLPDKKKAEELVGTLEEDLHTAVNCPCTGTFDMEYDRVVSLGEWLSTSIVHAYLTSEGYASVFGDARRLIITDSRHRGARIAWDESAQRVRVISDYFEKSDIVILQGFIGSTAEGVVTTLGREGSDFTASVLAYLLHARDVTIWKDVPGMLNADPKRFSDTVKLSAISYREAIELAYYGASVIHPKTIKPLQNLGIPLYIRSFIHPDEEGTVIQERSDLDHAIPSFIVKDDQVLISLSTRDFSFVVEDNLRDIFDVLVRHGVRIHLMENSAISFSMCMDAEMGKLENVFREFSGRYSIRYNEGVSLVTVRHYDDAAVSRLTEGRDILLEQRSRDTIRWVMR